MVPIEDHSDSMLVQIVHQEHKILGSPKARSGSEVSRHLITPGRVKRMLDDRQNSTCVKPHGVACSASFGAISR